MTNAGVTRIGVAVVEHDGKFLVGVRGAAAALAGCAEFPGGKCDAKESAADCACRECREEAGLAVEPVALIRELQHTYPHGTVALQFWHCRPSMGQRVGEASGGFVWKSPAELADLPFPEANRAVTEWIIARSRKTCRETPGDSPASPDS